MLRLVLSPRWIVWHVLTLGAMVTCGLLAAWQWGRAGSALGSAINIGYGVQWPLFAVFFGVMWWRFLRMEVQQLREIANTPGSDRQSLVARTPEPDQRSLIPRTPEPDGRAETTHAPGRDQGSARVSAEPSAARDEKSAASPFRRSPQRPPSVTDLESPALAEYNRMLAALAERDSRRG